MLQFYYDFLDRYFDRKGFELIQIIAHRQQLPRKDEGSVGGRDEVNAPGSAKNIHLIEESWQYKFIEHEKQHLVLNAWEIKSLKRGEDAVTIFEKLKD